MTPELLAAFRDMRYLLEILFVAAQQQFIADARKRLKDAMGGIERAETAMKAMPTTLPKSTGYPAVVCLRPAARAKREDNFKTIRC
jgi:hypothetical protein